MHTDVYCKWAQPHLSLKHPLDGSLQALREVRSSRLVLMVITFVESVKIKFEGGHGHSVLPGDLY